VVSGRRLARHGQPIVPDVVPRAGMAQKMGAVLVLCRELGTYSRHGTSTKCIVPRRARVVVSQMAMYTCTGIGMKLVFFRTPRNEPTIFLILPPSLNISIPSIQTQEITELLKDIYTLHFTLSTNSPPTHPPTPIFLSLSIGMLIL
jgi:hypothetical protein